jgi:hypothetical protein
MPYIDVNPNPTRSLKAITQTIYAHDQAPSPQEFSYCRELKAGRFHRDGKRVTWEQEIKDNKLTDIEVAKLEKWLKAEEEERARRQQDYQKKIDPLAQLPLEERVKVDSRLAGYMVLPCGHLRRRDESFSKSRPGVVICIHRECGRRFRYYDNALVDAE